MVGGSQSLCAWNWKIQCSLLCFKKIKKTLSPKEIRTFPDVQEVNYFSRTNVSDTVALDALRMESHRDQPSKLYTIDT